MIPLWQIQSITNRLHVLYFLLPCMFRWLFSKTTHIQQEHWVVQIIRAINPNAILYKFAAFVLKSRYKMASGSQTLGSKDKTQWLMSLPSDWTQTGGVSLQRALLQVRKLVSLANRNRSNKYYPTRLVSLISCDWHGYTLNASDGTVRILTFETLVFNLLSNYQ